MVFAVDMPCPIPLTTPGGSAPAGSAEAAIVPVGAPTGADSFTTSVFRPLSGEAWLPALSTAAPRTVITRRTTVSTASTGMAYARQP